jgi:hypothetical protein
VKRKRQTLDDLAQEQLQECITKAIDGIELRIESPRTRWVHILANRTRCEVHLVLSWGKVAALVVRLIKLRAYLRGGQA